jgi:hypothetical protein
MGDECICPWIFDSDYIRAIVTMRDTGNVNVNDEIELNETLKHGLNYL